MPSCESVIKRNGFERCIEFLNESNLIEGIKGIDYRAESFQNEDIGHFGAFILSQNQACERKPLRVKDLCLWQKLITREQELDGIKLEEQEIGHIRGPNNQKNVRIGKHIPPSYETVPNRIALLVEDINAVLADKEKLKDDVAYCEFLGKTFHQFEWIHPFSDGNGRVGRLLANYIATFCSRPLVVFRAEMSERNRYYEAHDTPFAMCCFMAKKIKEAVFGFYGSLLFKKEEQSGATIRYESANGESEELYEWHALKDKFPEPVPPVF
jgi:hypothetical protein